MNIFITCINNHIIVASIIYISINNNFAIAIIAIATIIMTVAANNSIAIQITVTLFTAMFTSDMIASASKRVAATSVGRPNIEFIHVDI